MPLIWKDDDARTHQQWAKIWETLKCMCTLNSYYVSRRERAKLFKPWSWGWRRRRPTCNFSAIYFVLAKYLDIKCTICNHDWSFNKKKVPNSVNFRRTQKISFTFVTSEWKLQLTNFTNIKNKVQRSSNAMSIVNPLSSFGHYAMQPLVSPQ